MVSALRPCTASLLLWRVVLRFGVTFFNFAFLPDDTFLCLDFRLPYVLATIIVLFGLKGIGDNLLPGHWFLGLGGCGHSGLLRLCAVALLSFVVGRKRIIRALLLELGLRLGRRNSGTLRGSRFRSCRFRGVKFREVFVFQLLQSTCVSVDI